MEAAPAASQSTPEEAAPSYATKQVSSGAGWRSMRLIGDLELPDVTVLAEERRLLQALCRGEARMPTAEGYSPGLFEQFATETDVTYGEQIDKDAPRTFDGFKPKPDAETVAKAEPQLITVLNAFASMDPDTGYCQGMNFLVGALILAGRPPKDAFWTFVSLMSNCSLAELYKPSSPCLPAYLQHFDTAVAARLPRLHAHFHQEGFPLQLRAVEWLTTLMTTGIEFAGVACIYDLVLLGFDDILIRLSLGLLTELHDELIEMAADELMMGFKAVVRQTAPRRLLRTALCIPPPQLPTLGRRGETVLGRLNRASVEGILCPVWISIPRAIDAGGFDAYEVCFRLPDNPQNMSVLKRYSSILTFDRRLRTSLSVTLTEREARGGDTLPTMPPKLPDLKWWVGGDWAQHIDKRRRGLELYLHLVIEWTRAPTTIDGGVLADGVLRAAERRRLLVQLLSKPDAMEKQDADGTVTVVRVGAVLPLADEEQDRSPEREPRPEVEGGPAVNDPMRGPAVDPMELPADDESCSVL